MSDPESPRFAKGDKTRRAILGDRFVDRAEAALTPLDTTFREFTTEAVWGTVWASDGLALREKSLVTVALLASAGQNEELGLHIHVARKNGATREDLMEVFLHVAAYAGVPRANQAIRVAKSVWAEMDAAQQG